MAEDRRAGIFLAYRTVMEGLYSDAKDLNAALGLLHQGVVSTSLLNYTRLDQAYAHVSGKGLAAFHQHYLLCLSVQADGAHEGA